MVRTNRWGRYAVELFRLDELTAEYVTAIEGYCDLDQTEFDRANRRKIFLTAEEQAHGKELHGYRLQAVRVFFCN